MIKSVTITSGYPMDITSIDEKTKTLANRLIKFTPGLNVLFGPNMCGKSTILKTIRVHGLTNAAWSNVDYMGYEVGETYHQKTMIGFFNKQLGFKAKVNIDGPVYAINDENAFNQKDGVAKGKGFGHGVINFKMGALLKMNSSKQSSGEIEMNKQYFVLHGLFSGSLKFDLKKFMDVYNRRKASGMLYIETLYKYAERTILKGGKPTIVLDEPEKHLSFENALGLFTGLLPQLSDAGYQIILASHFMLLPFMKDYNIIWLDRNKDTYINTIKKYVTSKTED